MSHLKPVPVSRLESLPYLTIPNDKGAEAREISVLAVVSLLLVGMFLMLLLNGCGVNEIAEPSVAPSAATQLGHIQGSNFGGHAPIVGANVYVMQIGAPAVGATAAHQTGYGSSVSSLLGVTYNNPLYPTIPDANGNYYVTTDGLGQFDVSGDYACTPGYPVYLYAAGGNPRTNPSVLVSKATVSSFPTGGYYTITLTSAGELLYQGESIRFAGTGTTGTFASYIVGQVTTVLGSNSPTSPTTTTFQIQVSSLSANGTILIPGATYSGLTLGTVVASQVNAVTNPAIANTAMLGLCPKIGSANFSYLNFVYINEVSTVAMAYAMAPFAVDSLHIGTSTTNLTGLQVAALNAATLYNIQGSGPTSTTLNGDYHTANQTTPNNSNGVVPYQTINTLANIVANCVDSANAVVGTTPTALQAESPGCSNLFLTATSNGIPVTQTAGGSTVPIDTATAMINLAHYPAGINTNPTGSYVDSTNPSTLFNLPTGNVPFTPQLSAAPKDWTLALTYKNIPTPSAIAIDASGDAYIGTSSSTAGYITELSPQGSVLATSMTSVPTLFGIAISPTVSGSYTVWATSNSNSNIYKFNSALTSSVAYTSTYTQNPTAIAIDGSSQVYVLNNSANYNFYYLSEFNSTGGLLYHDYNYEFSVANGIALSPTGAVWVCDTNNDFGLYPNPSTGNGNATFTNGFSGTGPIAVDYQGQAWVAGKQGQYGNEALVRSTTGGALTSYAINNYDNQQLGGLNNPVSVAVDGNNVNNGNTFNVWTANTGNNSVTAINSSTQYASLSPSVGYLSGTGLINTPSAIAVDNAGNVWVTNQGNSSVVEILGSASPVATPFSAMQPGQAP